MGVLPPLSSKTNTSIRRDLNSKQYCFCPHVSPQLTQNERSFRGALKSCDPMLTDGSQFTAYEDSRFHTGGPSSNPGSSPCSQV